MKSLERLASATMVAWQTALERACEAALIAAGGDPMRCVREVEPRAFCSTIKVDGKPFRRVELVNDNEALCMRIVTTDLTTKETAR